MNEQLLEGLRAAFEAHGISAAASGGALSVQDGLKLEPRVFQRGNVRGTFQVQVDFAIESPRLNGIPLLDSFAGVGDTAESAEKNAVLKFLQGSFHVIAESLTRHACEDGQVERDDWTGPAHRWRVCAGPVLLLNTRDGAPIEGFNEFFPQLTELFVSRMSAGPHWMRVFLGTLDGKHTGSEVLVDGQVWDAGQQLLDAHPWIYPQGYASLRHLLIALPPEA